MKKIITVIKGLILVSMVASAQTQLAEAKDELHKINKMFDSSLYVGFNVRITYHSDTVFGKYAFEEMDGRFIINNRHMYYRMGNNEYVQNDSFVFDIDHEQKVMVMTKDPRAAHSDLFAVKEFVDSVLTWYDTAYVIAVVDSEEVRGLQFTARYDSLLYQRFAIYYDTMSYRPTRYEIEFSSGLGEEDSVFLTRDTTMRTPYVKTDIKRRITMYFTDYFIPLEEAHLFLSEEYVYFNRQSKRYSPSEKYRGYSFYTSNMEQDIGREPSEVFSPPEENP